MMGKQRLELLKVVDTVTKKKNIWIYYLFAYVLVRLNHVETRVRLGQESIFYY